MKQTRRCYLTRVNNNQGFVLLEVLISMMILAISMTAILRGFMIAMSTVRDNQQIEVASLLAQSLLDDFELEPPKKGKMDGSFLDDERFGEPFKDYSWEIDVEEERVTYDEIPKDPLQELEPLYNMELKIIFDDGRYKRSVPLVINTRIMDVQLFSQTAIQNNQLF